MGCNFILKPYVIFFVCDSIFFVLTYIHDNYSKIPQLQSHFYKMKQQLAGHSLYKETLKLSCLGIKQVFVSIHCQNTLLELFVFLRKMMCFGAHETDGNLKTNIVTAGYAAFPRSLFTLAALSQKSETLGSS